MVVELTNIKYKWRGKKCTLVTSNAFVLTVILISIS